MVLWITSILVTKIICFLALDLWRDAFNFFILCKSVYFKTFQLGPNQPTPGGSRCEAALGLIIGELPGPGLAVCGLVVQELCCKDDLLTFSPVSVIVKYVNVLIPLFWCVQVDPLDSINVLIKN